LAASAAVTHELWPSRAAGSAAATGSGSAADASSVAAKVDGAVVDINTTYQYQQSRGAGTGIVLTSSGEVLTNNHVIQDATSISVTDIGNGRTYSARVVGYDATDDVAVLQLVDASGLKTASIGDSGSVTVGETVTAIGNAGGVGGTPSAASGSITALNQAITAGDELSGTTESLSNLIETDADIQSGDSGGPLVDRAGRVIGMDSAAAQGFSLQSASGGGTQGYAIPIKHALSIARQIEAGKASSTVHVGPTAFLGVLISSSSSSSSSSSFGAGSGSSVDGAPVSGVVSGGTAEQAGVAAGDVITSLNGQSVSSPSDLTAAMAQLRPGQTVQIGWTDANGAAHTATVTVQSGPAA
jgi:S1-C subfamily serine protease